MTFWKRQKHGDSKKSTVTRDYRGGRNEQAEHRGCQGKETILQDAVMMNISVYIFQTHRTHNSKSEPECKLWTLSDNDLSINVGSSSAIKVILWGRRLAVGEAVLRGCWQCVGTLNTFCSVLL